MDSAQLEVRFTPLDWIWTAVFIVLMTVCGGVFYRLGKKSESDFFVAGAVFALPFWVTWRLYKRFATEGPGDDAK